MITDIIFTALLIFSYVMGARKGFFKSVWRIAAWAITILLVWLFAAPLTEYISQTDIYFSMQEAIGQKLSQSNGEAQLLPAAFYGSVNENAASLIARAAVYIILVIAIRFLMGILFFVLNGISKLPIISFTNRLAGGALGIVNYFFIVTAVLAVIAIAGLTDIASAIQTSTIVKYLYNNNILLQLFM